jgi:diguanylate cyclase (GGDEF)-like protein/PAS domain S-box-containing protein
MHARVSKPEQHRGDPPPAQPDAAPLPDLSAVLPRLFSVVSDLIVVTSRRGEIAIVNPAWEATLGWSEEEIVGRTVFEFVHPDDRPATRTLSAEGPAILDHANRFRCKDGTWRWLLWSGRSDGEWWYAIAKDVTDRLSLERRALYDDLTGLATRGLLLDHLRAALHRLARAENRLVSVLFVDLDGFKLVNDSLGHEAGDELLVGVADRLRQAVRETDVISRFGGDEFVIVAEGLSREQEAILIAERVAAAVGHDFDLAGVRQVLSCSIGIASTRVADTDPRSLLREADIAMYRAKARPHNRVELFCRLG